MSASKLRDEIPRLNILVSYAYLQDDPTFQAVVDAIAPYCNVLIDSGAYTNFSSRLNVAMGKKAITSPLTIERYSDYISSRLIPAGVTQYIGMDEVRNKEVTDANLDYMTSKGLQPIPVFIEGYDEADLNRILAINERICVAGAIYAADLYITRRYQSIFLQSNKRAKIHALGYGRYPGIFHVPITSADSSTYATGCRFGGFVLYAESIGFIRISNHELFDGSANANYILHLLINHCHVTTNLIKSQQYNTKLSSVVNLTTILGYIRFMAHCQRKGVEYFFAAPAPEHIFTPLVVHRCLEEDGFDYPRAYDYCRQYRALGKQERVQFLHDLCAKN